MITGASEKAANLHANWLGNEVSVSHPDGVVTAVGTLDKFTISKRQPIVDEKGNSEALTGFDKYAVKLWIQGYKLELSGGDEITLLDGGLPKPLPAD